MMNLRYCLRRCILEPIKDIFKKRNSNKLKNPKLFCPVNSTVFSARLAELEKYLSERNISKNDVCLVGSSVMDLYGIRESADFDIVFANADKLGFPRSPAIKLNSSHTLEKVCYGWLRDNNSKILIDDDELVHNKKHYVVYKGFKFVNLEYVYKKKSFTKREKDLKDLEMIEKTIHHLYFLPLFLPFFCYSAILKEWAL